jgi:hypothetical protein
LRHLFSDPYVCTIVITHAIYSINIVFRWEVIVNFVDIGGIGDYHSWNFPYLITNGECTMREAISAVRHILEICKYIYE